MADQLRLDYEGIENSRAQLLEQLEVFDDCYSRMNSIIKNLPEYWSGDTAVAYGIQFDNLAPSFNNISELISALAQQLSDIQTNFAGADGDMSAKLM
ncbi:MAG: WXG100 family type VII secretion target [Eubacterium sp.]